MKRFLKGLRSLLWRHKILSMICLLSLVIIIILLYIFCSIFVGSNGKYGHRLDGIKTVEISKKELSSVKDEIIDNKEVDSAKVRLEGKIIYIDITFNKDTNKDKAKEISSKVLDSFGDKEKEFYDFEFILDQKTEKDKEGFKITGTKSPKKDKISWIKS